MELSLLGKYRMLVAKLNGELDHHIATSVREAIDHELERTSAIHIAFDFRNVSFMDSSGIGVIMGRYKKVHMLGGQVFIFGASDVVRRIIDMSGIREIVTVADTLEEGIAQMQEVG